MQPNPTNNNTLLQQKKKVMVVTCDMPSHAYAVAKLARLLQQHRGDTCDVFLAAPANTKALRLCMEETKDTNVTIISLGETVEGYQEKKHMSDRPVTNPNSLKVILDGFRSPFPLIEGWSGLFDREISNQMYDALRMELHARSYDVVIPTHCCFITICDAVESLNLPNPPAIGIFSSLPYDPTLYLDLANPTTWSMPRGLTNFPHVSAYSAKPNRRLLGLGWLCQLFWQVLDALLTTWVMQRQAKKLNNERRARRGLKPLEYGFTEYLKRLPVVSFGGVFPFVDEKTRIAENITVVGSFEASPKPIADDLASWMTRKASTTGLVYMGFGTGTQLTNQEAESLVREIQHLDFPVLFALSRPEQQRLRMAIDKGIGASPTYTNENTLEYLDGKIRIQSDVQQASLLLSGKVRLFISHLGMGAFTEGSRGGVPFLAYPAGCDQWYNAARMVDAGLGLRLPYGRMDKAAEYANRILENESFQTRSRDVAERMMKSMPGEEVALTFVDNLMQ